ncbi:1-deoxy-D-xylulose-5-phosphate synthase [Pseudotabrizicola sediminis]|uniref:1-deoxy-D-xylulose-5-phosphate synthase n=1 Tax=Pseudotabrizicola sediminis TaxID=2486418 RepID=A0ABY2KPD8_9RHOB|nr:RC-LH1 core complex protein PufX [Pseudotabrizicola sediminis]TGD42893.1 1-deoxy-D-xylulose-5-phosphate synthase [Pseudotabrizicola sediminis]
MSDHPFYRDENPKSRLRIWIFGQMMYGAMLAAAVFVACLLFFAVFYGIGLLLPEESRQTPDPMPRSSLEQPLAPAGHDLA